MKPKNKLVNVLLTSVGCILVIIALILHTRKLNRIVVNSIFSLGVIFEGIYKAKMLLEKKNKNEKYNGDIVIIVVYALLIAAMWFM